MGESASAATGASDSANSLASPRDPSELVPAPALGERLTWYTAAVAVTTVLILAGMRIDAVDLRAPLAYDGDALLIMPFVKATVETGFGGHWRIERLGYPGVLELHDYPVIDHVHFALIWLLGLVVSNWVVVFNVYFLLTWPLTALTGMYAFRRLGLTLPMAAVGGTLFAFLPYHYLRSESHYFLAAYWMVPLSWLPALDLCRGRLPFFRQTADGRYAAALGRRAALWLVLLMAATASAGAYYAFFACAIYAFAGLYGWVTLRAWKAAASAVLLCTLVAAFGILNHLPTITHSMQYGRNAVTERQAAEAESHGLKFAHLVLPADNHNLAIFRRLKSRFNTPDRPLQNENTTVALGAVASIGFLGLLASLVFFPQRGWPFAPLAALTAMLFLYATIGGVSSVFNLLVFDQIRCPNRVCVYLAFICMLAVLWPLDRFLATRTGRGRRWRYPAVVLLGYVGIADQTPHGWFTAEVTEFPHLQAERFRADHRFFEQIEATLGPGGKVFTCPYIPFPEEFPLHAMNTYEPVRGYLHTRGVLWSYGAMKHREVDVWLENVSHDAPDELLRRIAVSGFDGLQVDKRGFDRTKGDPGEALLTRLRDRIARLTGVPPQVIRHEDGEQAFLDIRPYREWLRKSSPAQFERWGRHEREWVALTWINGTLCREAYGRRDHRRWGFPKTTAVIVNPSERTRRYRFSVTFAAEPEGQCVIRIDAPTIAAQGPDGPWPWSDAVTIEQPEPGVAAQYPRQVRKDYVLEIPPGRHVVRFQATPPSVRTNGAANFLCYFLEDIRFDEVP